VDRLDRLGEAIKWGWKERQRGSIASSEMVDLLLHAIMSLATHAAVMLGSLTAQVDLLIPLAGACPDTRPRPTSRSAVAKCRAIHSS
jgi:hypothetical protein